MADTWKDKRKFKTKKFWHDYWQDKKSYVGEHGWLLTNLGFSFNTEKIAAIFVTKNKEFTSYQQLYTDYNCCGPSWFKRLKTTKLIRQQNRILIGKELKGFDDQLFPLARKPKEYWW